MKSPIKNMAYWKSKSNVAPLKQMVKNPNDLDMERVGMDPNKPQDSGLIEKKVDAKVEEKVNEVVNKEQGEGLV
tara:strand:- start:914 stop:1135 length:222 start_codon:yes stop_codon:yes gene_type:complete